MKVLRFICILSFAVFTIGGNADGITDELPRSGKPLQRLIVTGEVHLYRVSVSAGQILSVSAAQVSADIALNLLTPEGIRILRANSVQGIGGQERIAIIAPVEGIYQIQVELDPEAQLRGCYRIRIEDLREAQESDFLFAAALYKRHQAEQLRNEGSAIALEEASELALESISMFRKLQDSYFEAESLWVLCEINYYLNRTELSLSFCNDSLTLFRELKDKKGIAESLNTLGVIQDEAGNLNEARASYEQSLDLWRSINDKHGEALALHNLGVSFYRAGDQNQALKHYEQAIPLWEATGDTKALANTLSCLGLSYSAQSEIHKAISYYSKALPLQRSSGDLRAEAATLNNLGMLFVDLGELQKALDALNHALDISKVLGDRRSEGITLNNIGLVYYDLGEIEKSLSFYNSSLTIRREVGDRGGEAATLNNIGKAFFGLDRPEEALNYYNQSLELARAFAVRVGEAHILNNMGDLYQKQGDFSRAFDYYNEALELRRKLGDRPGEAAALDSLGTNLLSFGELQKAARMYGLALRLERQIGDKTGEAQTLYHIAELKRVQGRLTEAREYIESSVDLLESLRVRMMSQSLKASFLASSRAYYEFYIRLLFELQDTEPNAHYDEIAFHINERSRARGLMEQLAEASVDITEGVDEQLLLEEKAIRESLNAQLDRQMKLLSGEHSKKDAERLASLIEYFSNRYEQVETRIRRTSPRYAEIIKPQPLTLKKVQDQLLDDNTLLLEYSIGEEKSFVWAVWKNGYKTVELAGRNILEHGALELYEHWSGETMHEIHSSGQILVQPAAPRAGTRQASWLTKMLLEPVADQLNKRRMIIVPDGALYFVPFGALPVPGNESVRLAAQHEITNVPSASTLAILRQEEARKKESPAIIAVLADPVFDLADERLKSMNSQKRSGLEKASAKPEGFHLGRLPFTRREAKSILSMVPESLSLEALDFKASRQTMFSPELRNYRYIHLATHGFLNTLNPDQSGIVLSLFDENGEEQKGFVSAGEIFNLKLNADLVVLSACRTGLGKQIRGEGLLGLPRAFLYAGAERVVASLWKVDDIASAEFMSYFYEAMLGSRKLTPSQALQDAQLRMQNDPRWQSPYFWGAFVLQGDF
jgi:CHAT domain-containing protein/Tfp pilus assembly protein PilF